MSSTKIILIAASAENHLSTLSNIIEKHCAHTAILAIAHNIEEGEEQIKEKSPHLVILELSSKDNSGLELLEKFKRIPFQVIIVSSNAEFNSQVMNFHPLHYMILPVANADLKLAIIEACKQKKEHNIDERLTNKENMLGRTKKLTRIGFLNKGVTEYHSVKEIMYIEADGKYCRFHLNNDLIKLVTHILKFYEDHFSKKHFVKISRSYMINKDFIKNIHQGTPIKLEMMNGQILEVSRDYKTDFKAEMERN